MMSIGNGPEFEFLRLGFEGFNRTVVIRKNAWVEVDLNTVTFEIDPTSEHEGGPAALLWQQITNLPSLGGAQPGSWNYAFDVHVGGGTYVLTIRQNSSAIRSGNCKTDPHIVGPTEELVIAAPSGGLILTASRDVPKATGTIKARLLLRDCSD